MEAPILLESASAAGALLRAYDARTNRWAFPQAGDFWDAVRAAHQRGQRGAGARVAIIDTACDLRIPVLARGSGGRPMLAGGAGEPTEHGTAVALLVATVAPEATLDLYAITRNGAPDPALIEAALEQIDRSAADIVCMSLGLPQNYNLDAVTAWVDACIDSGRKGGYFKAMIDQGGMPKHEISACQPRICLCKSVNRLHQSGKRVLAAVGNTAGKAFCPASAAGAIAVGFQLDRREVVAQSWEAAWAADPGYDQSALSDFTLMQPPQVLGSSFATPLLAGALALGIGSDDMTRLLVCGRIGAIGDQVMGEWYSRVSRERDQDAEARLTDTYGHAITAHPYFPNLEPDTLLGSAIFTGSYMINAGLFFMLIGELDLARVLLAWCRQVAPGNCHAAANLGKTLYLQALEVQRAEPRSALALARQSSREYAEALRLRPGFEPYAAVKRKIDAFIAAM